ncbi:MAG: DUF5979 domain-containing protein [Coriobacteriia bacterium]|nr:DUF5979 domain-containing protein [Coriobacteriia bacterium]
MKDKKMKVVLIAMLALTLCFGMLPSAYADINPEDVTEAAITKVLKFPVGTDYPAMTFNFAITAVKFNEDTTLPSDMPFGTTPGSVSIAYSGKTAASPDEKFESVVSGIETYYLESADIFAGVVWPTAGVYEFVVTETGSTYTVTDPAHEALTLSDASYSLVVYVKEYTASNVPTGKSVGDRYIFAIGNVMTITDGGEPVENGPKLDPTPGGDPSVEGDYSEMIFVNRYVRTNGSNDPDDPTLSITKTVTGDMGSIVKPFSFTLTLTVPTLIEDYVEVTYPAYKVSAAGVVSATAIEVTPGTPLEFTLAHGEKLVFTNVPVGSSYAISEDGETGYTASVDIIKAGATAANETGTKGNGVSVAAGYWVGESDSTHANTAKFTNDNPGTTPTGIVIEYLPYIGIFTIAIAGLVIYVIAKRRERESLSA